MHIEIDPDLFKATDDSPKSIGGRGNTDGRGIGEDAKEGSNGNQKGIDRFWRLIFDQSAIVGQDWRPKTAKELFIQWQAKVIYDWHHTTSLRILHLDMKKTTYEELHPYLKKARAKIKLVTRKKSLFTEG